MTVQAVHSSGVSRAAFAKSKLCRDAAQRPPRCEENNTKRSRRSHEERADHWQCGTAATAETEVQAKGVEHTGQRGNSVACVEKTQARVADDAGTCDSDLLTPARGKPTDGPHYKGGCRKGRSNVDPLPWRGARPSCPDPPDELEDPTAWLRGEDRQQRRRGVVAVKRNRESAERWCCVTTSMTSNPKPVSA